MSNALLDEDEELVRPDVGERKVGSNSALRP